MTGGLFLMTIGGKMIQIDLFKNNQCFPYIDQSVAQRHRLVYVSYSYFLYIVVDIMDTIPHTVCYIYFP